MGTDILNMSPRGICYKRLMFGKPGTHRYAISNDLDGPAFSLIKLITQEDVFIHLSLGPFAADIALRSEQHMGQDQRICPGSMIQIVEGFTLTPYNKDRRRLLCLTWHVQDSQDHYNSTVCEQNILC